MVDAFLGIAKVSKKDGFAWKTIRSFVTVLFDESSPGSLNRVIPLASPYLLWYFNEDMVARLEVAASAISYTDEVGSSVVTTLLRMASTDTLSLQIPIGIWAWLKKRPSFLPVDVFGILTGTEGDVVRQVRALGDVEILKSYLLLVWSERGKPWFDGFSEMRAAIREDFGGIGMGRHRGDLIRRLDRVLQQWDLPASPRRPRYVVSIRRPRGYYERLMEVLLEVEWEATQTLARTLSRLIDLSIYSS